ncbi:MAG: ATP-binding protein [Acidobacteriota bacterium]|nr:ATP-binding protein [Acidobacteriota bacterium]
MEFINRETELAFLEGCWREESAGLVVLWGKRRVGKTELVKRFVEGKPHIYFLAETTGPKEQLLRFSRAVGRFFSEPLLETRGFTDWEEIFVYLRKKNRRIVLAVDEFPYLIQSNPAAPSLFQKGWDEHLSKSPVCLVLLGSSIAMMENEVLGRRSPLFGRRTGQWRVDPMSFRAASGFRKGSSFEDRLSHYAVAGGIPAYWLQFDRRSDIWRNIEERVLSKGRFLYDEVEFLLREELREPRYYFALLQAVAQGRRKLSEIVNATGLAQAAANKYLGVLADLKIVERETPVTEERPLKSKKGLYRIVDNFVHFWFKFVFPRRADLELGKTGDVLRDIRRDWAGCAAPVYEQVAREILMENEDRFFRFDAVGRWWDKGEEIDLVALNRETKQALLVEVKWSERPVGLDIYEGLKAKAGKVRKTLGTWGGEADLRFCLFGKKGFTEAVMRKAAEEGVALFTGEGDLQA